MAYVLKCVALVGRAENPEPGYDPVGNYLASYDPQAADGRGDLVLTSDVLQAMTFERPSDASRLLWHQPTLRPLRDDGLPNRPLRSFTWELLELR